MPRTFRLSHPLEPYNRMRDLDAFIRKYNRAMEVKEANEASLCKCFEIALIGPASSWYNSLPQKLIGSFGEPWSKEGLKGTFLDPNPLLSEDIQLVMKHLRQFSFSSFLWWDHSYSGALAVEYPS